MRKLSLCVLMLAVSLTAMAQTLPDHAGPLLQKALADPAATMQRDDGTFKVWVSFTDRGLSPAALEQALSDRRAELPTRTLERRAKVTPAGQALVDARDLPVSADHRRAVLATGAVVHHESRWFNALSVRATREQLVSLGRLPMVDRLELVATFRRPAPPVDQAQRELSAEIMDAARERAAQRDGVNYGASLATLEQINVPAVHDMGITGQGIIVGMLDSGFKTTHEALVDIPVLARYDFINDDEIVENEAGDPSSQHNHGTQTFSTAMGFKDGELVGPAFGASAILAKTEDVSDEYPAEEDNWVAGLEWVESLGADLVSSSLGYYDWYEFADLDGNTAVTTIAADMAVGRGLLVVNSAGNERGFGFGHIIAPADGDSVIAVGAVNLSGDIASFSSPGPSYDGRIKPDVSAQGVNNHVVSPSNDTGYSIVDGTSFSCPLTAGVAALVLSRAPELTPMQVREALRQTADRADNPDNDYGWGIIDAHAAVTYWGATIDHTPLTDTEDTVSDLVITATITDRLPLDTRGMNVVYQLDGGPWLQAPLAPVGGDVYEAVIAAQPAGTDVAYYLEVLDSAEITTRLPVAGASAPFTFHVGPDATLPTLVHTPLGNQPLITWPPLVACEADDNLGIDRVELTYTLNGGAEQGPFLLEDRAGGEYVLPFPLSAAELQFGDQISYRLTVFDASSGQLSTTTGWLDFEIIDTLGVVLVVDDSGSAAAVDEVKFDEFKRPVPARSGGRSAATDMAQWLVDAGYVADVVAASTVSPGSFDGYQAVVYSAGDNTTTMSSAELRNALVAWAEAGGRLLVEGGEVGYDALSSPGYPDIAASVLHATSWNTDNAGDLEVVAAQTTHPFMVRPHALPAAVDIAYSGYGDEDAITPASGALVIMDPANQAGKAGVMVWDDNPAPQAGQIVVFSFNVGVIDATLGAQMTANALSYLLAEEAPATAAISGTVTLAGETAADGVTVSLGAGYSVLTGPDGAYTLDDLYGGIYTVTASKAGFTTAAVQVTLEDGQLLGGIDFELVPVIQVDYAVSPGLAIPDNNPSGIVSQINVGEPGAISSVTVDLNINHTYIGDLTVTLIAPTGESVVLHNRSGGSSNDIEGNYPETLSVDGPGALIDFTGVEAAGLWTLHVSDSVGSDTGTLNSWGLHLMLPDQVTATDVPLAVTRLVGNRPNPFNPRTTMAFELARGGQVRLSLYDLRGRKVRDLVRGVLPAGHHEVLWDGRDQAGRDQSSGVYLARFQADGVVQEHKLVLVR